MNAGSQRRQHFHGGFLRFLRPGPDGAGYGDITRKLVGVGGRFVPPMNVVTLNGRSPQVNDALLMNTSRSRTSERLLDVTQEMT